MSEEYPLPRSVRETSYEASAAQTTFGPLAWYLFSLEDVLVYRAAPGSSSEVLVDSEEYTVTPASTLPGLFSIVFDEGQAEGATIKIKGARTHERLTNVTQQGIIRSLPLEEELDRIGVVLQELRRDNDRSVSLLDDAQAAAAASEAAQVLAEAAAAIAGPAATAAQNAQAAAEAAAAGLNLPSIAPGDALKLLQVNAGETGYQHAAVALSDYLTKADNLNSVANKPTAFSNIKQAATEDATGVVEEATAAEILAGTADKFIECEKLEDAMEPVALADGANISVNLSTGVYFTVTLGGNRQLDNPTNHKVGRTIALRVTQDGGGGRTLSYDTQYDFGQDSAPVLSTGAGIVDVIFFYVLSATKLVYLGLRKGV